MRALLVLAIMTSSASAFAPRYVRAPFASCDVTPATYPSNGATNVPRNSRAWVVAGNRGTYELIHGTTRQNVKAITHDPFRVVELVLPHLEPNTSYELVYAGSTLTTFTTGTTDDATPPRSPGIGWVSAWSSHGAPIRIHFDTTDDVVIAELTALTDHGTYTLLAPPSSLRAFGGQCAGFDLAVSESFCVEIAGIDLSGNRSTTWRRCTTVNEWPGKYEDSHRPTPAKAPMWPWHVLLTVLALMCSLGLLRYRAERARMVGTSNPLTPIATEVVRRLAQAHVRRAEWMLVGCAIAMFVLDGMIEPWVAGFLAPVPLAIGVVAIANARRVERVLASLIVANVGASYDGRRHIFTQPAGWLAVLPTEVDRATKAALPKAKIR